MAYQHYDRLTALDAMFLDLEETHVHMHVGAVALFDAAPLTNADWEALPDIHGMVKGLHEEFESLHKTALKS